MVIIEVIHFEKTYLLGKCQLKLFGLNIKIEHGDVGTMVFGIAVSVIFALYLA